MKFELRPVEEIKKDITTAKEIADQIRELSRKLGYGDDVREAAAGVYHDPPTEGFRVVSLWLSFGAETVFLQDADSLIMKTPNLMEVLRFLKETFPCVTRVTSYGRLKTAAKKTVEELREIHEAGLTRLHMGFESGCDAVLNYIRKGITAEDQIKGGRNVVGSGISLCLYVMPGVGGRRWSKDHATESAMALNEINPDFIRLRSLSIREDIPLYQKWKSGDFELLSDDEVVEEVKELIERLDVTSYLASDHIENLLQEVEGQLPEDKGRMLEVIDKYQRLTPDERLNFQFGQRAGYYSILADLQDPYTRQRVDSIMAPIIDRGEDVQKLILNLKKRFLV